MNNIDFIQLKRKGNKVEFTATDEQIEQLADASLDLLSITDAIEHFGNFLNLCGADEFQDNHIMAIGTIFEELGKSMRYKVSSKLCSVSE